MKAIAAIVEPAIDFDQNTRAILKEHVALQDDERNADAHERKSVGFRESASRRRLEMGRRLVEQKRSGKIKHGGWLPYLEKLGIESQRASEWMRLAGYQDSTSKSPTSSNGGNLPAVSWDSPTLADAGIDKRPRKRDEQPDAPTARNIDKPTPSLEPTPYFDIDRELSRIQDKLCTAAESASHSVRKQIAHELRETARLIEEMS